MKSLVYSKKCTNFAPRNQGIVPRWLKTIEKMDNSKGLEWFKKNLQVVIDGKDSKISDLEAKIDVLENENRNLKSLVDYLECQIDALRIINNDFKTDIRFKR